MNAVIRDAEHTLASGRVVWVNHDGTVDLDYDAAAYEAAMREEAEGEARAEFAMSWVHGGGRAEDVNAAYRQWNAMKAGRHWTQVAPSDTQLASR